MLDVASVTISVDKVDNILGSLNSIFIGDIKNLKVVDFLPYLLKISQILGCPLA